MAQISESNFAAFVDTMASVLEDIEQRQAANRPTPWRSTTVQLELPLEPPTSVPPTLYVVHVHRQRAA